MSAPGQFGPRPPQSGSGNRVMVLVLLGAALVTLVWCSGLIAIGALAFSWTRTDVRRMRASIQGRMRPQPPAQPPLIAPQWQTDWVAMNQLTPVYTAALDAVTADPPVIEKLGSPIEIASDSDSLFRRERTGPWTGKDETIEFDIQGPKGKAVVRVTANMPTPVSRGIRPMMISVVLADGTEIDVPPPAKQNEPEP